MLWVPTYLLSYPLRGKIDEDLRALGGNAMEKMTNAQWWVSTLLQAAACESKQSPDKRQHHIHLFPPLFEFVCLSHPPVCLFSSEYVFSYRLCDFLVKMTIIPAVSWRIIQHDQRIIIILLIRLNYHNLFINDIKARSELQRPPLVASFCLKGALIMTDDQESSLFHHLFIFFSVLANFLWRNDNRKGSRSQSAAGHCDSGPVTPCRDFMWCQADVIPGEGEFTTLLPKWWGLGATSGAVWKEDLPPLMSGSQHSVAWVTRTIKSPSSSTWSPVTAGKCVWLTLFSCPGNTHTESLYSSITAASAINS